MLSYFTQADADYGRRVAEGLSRPAPSNGHGDGAHAAATEAASAAK